MLTDAASDLALDAGNAGDVGTVSTSAERASATCIEEVGSVEALLYQYGYLGARSPPKSPADRALGRFRVLTCTVRHWEQADQLGPDADASACRRWPGSPRYVSP